MFWVEKMELKKAKQEDTVSVDYIGTLDDGTIFDTNIEEIAKNANHPKREAYEPLTFTIGTEQVLKGFEEAIIGMVVGEEKEIKIKTEEAYGKSNPRNIITIPSSNIDGEDLAVGRVVYHSTGAKGIVTNIEDNLVTMDFNHQLAGKDLNFKIILKKIE